MLRWSWLPWGTVLGGSSQFASGMYTHAQSLLNSMPSTIAFYRSEGHCFSVFQFVAGLGTGSASLVWHVSGWTLGSISGFSTAAARILQRSMAARQADMCASHPVACLLSHAGNLRPACQAWDAVC